MRYHTSSKKNQHGFTLIELSVVLLVLAFLVGGVLISKKVVDRSKAQSVITDFDTLKKAISLFKDAYGYLPGDIPVDILKTIPEFVSFCSAASSTSGCAYTSSITLQSLTTGGSAVAYKELFNPVGSNIVNVAASTFGMRQMQIAGFISGVTNVASGAKDSSAALSISTTDGVAPVYDLGSYATMAGSGSISKKSKSSASNVLVYGTPFSATNNSGANIASFSITSTPNDVAALGHAFSQNKNLGASAAGYYDYGSGKIAIALYNASDLNLGAVPSTVMYMVDLKTDDGIPYTGNVIGDAWSKVGVLAKYAPGGSSTITARVEKTSPVCTNASIATMDTVTPYGNAALNSATYLTSSALNKGCNAFVFMQVY